MKKILYGFILVVFVVALSACNNGESEKISLKEKTEQEVAFETFIEGFNEKDIEKMKSVVAAENKEEFQEFEESDYDREVEVLELKLLKEHGEMSYLYIKMVMYEDWGEGLTTDLEEDIIELIKEDGKWKLADF